MNAESAYARFPFSRFPKNRLEGLFKAGEGEGEAVGEGEFVGLGEAVGDAVGVGEGELVGAVVTRIVTEVEAST